jgi:hypothetical protein
MPRRYVPQASYVRNGNRALNISSGQRTSFNPVMRYNPQQRYLQRVAPRTFTTRTTQQLRVNPRIAPSAPQQFVARRPFAPVQIVQQKKPGLFQSLIGRVGNFLLNPQRPNPRPTQGMFHRFNSGQRRWAIMSSVFRR